MYILLKLIFKGSDSLLHEMNFAIFLVGNKKV